MTIEEIDRKIEVLRQKLYTMAAQKDYHFVDEEIMRVSQRLDVLLVQRERCKIVRCK